MKGVRICGGIGPESQVLWWPQVASEGGGINDAALGGYEGFQL